MNKKTKVLKGKHHASILQLLEKAVEAGLPNYFATPCSVANHDISLLHVEQLYRLLCPLYKHVDLRSVYATGTYFIESHREHSGST
jgi:hypothetical protein